MAARTAVAHQRASYGERGQRELPVCPGPTLTAADGGDGAIGVGTASAHAGKTQRRIVSAWIGTAYAQEDSAAGHAQWRTVADQLRPKVPKLAP